MITNNKRQQYSSVYSESVGTGVISIDKEFISGAHIQAQINTICNSEQASVIERSFLENMIKLENYSTTKGGIQGFVRDFDGSFRGVAQFNEYTWKLIQDKGFPFPYSEVNTPWVSLLAALWLFRENEKYHRANFNEPIKDWRIGYLYHNQGASAANRFLRSGILNYPHQSFAAKKIFKEILNES